MEREKECDTERKKQIERDREKERWMGKRQKNTRNRYSTL